MTLLADVWTGGLIGFREALEATLLVTILLLILNNTNRGDLVKTVWKGVGVGLGASVLTAIVFEWLIGSFESNEAWFEGMLMVISSVIIAFVILHLVKHLSKSDLETYAAQAMVEEDRGVKAMFLIAFFSVWREGTETVVFLSASTDSLWAVVGLLIGMAISIGLGWGMMQRGLKVNIGRLFSVSTTLLLLVGAGLLAHGIHEFQEDDVGWVPVLVEEVWDVNPEWDGMGDAPLFHDKGAIGGTLTALFGWNGNPNLLEVVAYAAYFGGMYALVKRASHSKPISPSRQSEHEGE